MPAYRSPAEAEVRDAVVAHIRAHRPSARIIHEINVSCYGPNRIDLIAVSKAEIIAVEIKSAKDKLDRLPAQIAAMRSVAHRVVVGLHEKFLAESTTHEKARHYERDGKFYLRRLPDGWDHSVLAWVYPRVRRTIDPSWEYDRLEIWKMPQQRLDAPLPWAALGLLWRDELYELCGSLRVSAGRRANMDEMTEALRWHCTGKELTLGICAMLRARHCIEADPEIFEEQGA
jgi:hypothetical protein